MTRTPIPGFHSLYRARMIRELTMFIMRNLGNPAIGWVRRDCAARHAALSHTSVDRKSI